MDLLNKDRRSENMRRIRHKNTSPELMVRRLVTKLGFRYRLHVKELPGKPDLTFRGKKRVIFVHGCFWHQHADCREGRIPSSRSEYWGPKLRRNVERDDHHAKILKDLGWEVLVIWECELADPALSQRLQAFLDRRIAVKPQTNLTRTYKTR